MRRAHSPPQSGECTPQQKNITTLINVQSGFEWFELFGLFRLFQLCTLLQFASVRFWLRLDVSSFFFQKQCWISQSRFKRFFNLFLNCATLFFAVMAAPVFQSCVVGCISYVQCVLGWIWLF